MGCSGSEYSENQISQDERYVANRVRIAENPGGRLAKDPGTRKMEVRGEGVRRQSTAADRRLSEGVLRDTSGRERG